MPKLNEITDGSVTTEIEILKKALELLGTFKDTLHTCPKGHILIHELQTHLGWRCDARRPNCKSFDSFAKLVLDTAVHACWN